MPYALIVNDTSTTLHYGCNAVMTTLVEGLGTRNILPSWMWPVGVDWRDHRAFLLSRQADVVVVNGEGTIHHSADRERARSLCRIPELARAKGVPAILVNASIEALQPDCLDALRLYDAVFVREARSRRYLASHGIDAAVTPDLSLGVPSGASSERRNVLVTDSVVREATTALRDFANSIEGSSASMRLRPTRWQRRLSRAATVLGHRKPGRARYVPTRDPGEFIARLRRSRAVVAGRFHAVTLCLHTDTPFLAIRSNTSKIEATLEDALGDTTRLVDIDSLRGDEARTRLTTGIGFSKGELEALVAYRARAARDREHMFDAIAGLAAGNRNRMEQQA